MIITAILSGSLSPLIQSRLNDFEDLDHKYRAVKDENRRLFNAVQDLKGAIRVYCRIRPSGRTGDQSAACLEVRGGEGKDCPANEGIPGW